MAIHLVHECNLYDAVFAFLPPAVAATIKKHPTAPSDSLTASSFLHRLVNPLQSTIGLAAVHPALLSQLKVDSGCLARLFLAASFSSYSDATYVDQKKKTVPAISLLLRESLRLGTQHHFLDGIPALMAASGVLKNPGRFDSPDQRVEIGEQQCLPSVSDLDKSQACCSVISPFTTRSRDPTGRVHYCSHWYKNWCPAMTSAEIALTVRPPPNSIYA